MVLPRGAGGRGGYHSRGGSSRGGGRSSYHGSGSYHNSNHNSSYDNRNDSRNNRYGSSSAGGGGTGGGGYDSRNSSRYESDSRYSRHDNRNDTYKRTNSSKYEDNRDRRSPDRKRPRNDHNSQGGSSRRDYGGSGSSGVGGRGGGSSSNRYHEGGSSGSGSYDKRGSHDHHSSTSGGGAGDGSSNRSKFDPHHRSSSSASRSHGDSGSSYRSRDNNSSSMGPPRSVAMRTSGSGSAGRSMMRPPMGDSSRMIGGGRGSSSSSLGSGIGGGIHRRGTMRGRISHYRSDGRRGMLSSRIIGGHHRRMDMRPMSLHNRRFPSIRGRGELRSRIIGGGIVKRTLDLSARRSLIKKAIAAARDLVDDSASENDDEDDDGEEDDVDEDAGEPSPKKPRKRADTDDADAHPRKDQDDDDEELSKAKIKQEKREDDSDVNTTGGTVSGEQTPIKKKIIKKEPSILKKTVEDSKSVCTDEGSEKKRSTKITTKYRSSSFIKLTCAHCNLQYVTFKEYQTHLYSRSHKLKMRQVAVQCRERLLEMRAAQRNAQKDVDEKSEDGADGDDGGVKQRAGFCMLCRLNYRQPRITHQQSEAHKEMKNFLMPFCNVCKISFKSPMAYETHRASLDHLKIKARAVRYASPSKAEDSGDELAGDMVDMDSLTIVDEVGKVDEICEPGVEKESGKHRDYETTGRIAGTEDEDDDDDDEADDGEDMPMVIGQEYVMLVQVQYCEMCNMYLHDGVNTREQTLRDHCRKPIHLKNYIRIRNDKKLRERAERIHKKKIKGEKGITGTKKVDEKKSKDSSTASGSAESKSSTAASNTSANTGAASAGAAHAISGDAGEAVTADKKHDPNESSNNLKSESAAMSKSTSAGKVNVEEPTTAVASSEESVSLDASKDADNASLSGDVNASLIDDKLMWQVVDNDELGDLLRDVNEAEEEDDDKTSLERYDKFRHTEKNGLEQQALANAGDADEDDDCAESDGVKTSGQVKSATNGDTENGDASKEKVNVV